MGLADVATLAIQVDSSQVKTASTNLDNLTKSAKPAADAADKVSHAHAGLSTQAMAAQHSLRSMVEGLAAGIPPSQVLAQQLNHLSYAASGPGGLKGAFGEVFSILKGFVTPTTLVAAGLVGVAAAGALVYSSIINTGKALDDAGRSAGTTAGQMQALQAAASLKGIDNADFFKSMSKFAGDVYQAQHNMGGLADVFRANNSTARDFNGYLEKAADLIQNASSDQQRLQLLQQMGLPATMEWVRFLSQGSASIKDAVAQASVLSERTQKLVDAAREFDEGWTRTWTNFKTGAENAFLAAGTGLDKLRNLVTRANIYFAGPTAVGNETLRTAATNGTGSRLGAASDISGFYKGLGTGNVAEKQTVDPNVAAHNLAIEQQRLGLLGQTATVGQQVRAVEISIAQARAAGVNITKQEADTLRDLARERALGTEQIHAQADALRVETATIGLSAGAAAEYTAVQNRLNQAVRDHQTLTDADVQKIRNEASALGRAAQTADTMKFAYEGLVRGPMQAFTQAIQNGSNFFDALKQSGISALNSLSSKLTDIAAQNLWASAFGGKSGGGGLLSGLGSLFGGGGVAPEATTGLLAAHHTGYGPGDPINASRVVSLDAFRNAPRFHSGIGPGERAAIIRNDESVLTPGQMKAIGGAGTIHIESGDIIIQGSADKNTLAVLKAELAKRDAELPHRVIAAVRTAQTQRKL